MCPLRIPTDPFQSLPEKGEQDLHNIYLPLIREAVEYDKLPIMCGKQLERMSGTWHSYFHKLHNTSSLLLEIGCHRGNVLCDIAQDFKNLALIGLDITLKRVYLSALRAHKLHLNTCIRILYFHAAHLQHLFSAEEIQVVIIFFPDPWNKKTRQQKHRLLNAQTIRTLHYIIAKGGHLWLKTDDASYFQTSCKLLCNQGFIDVSHQPFWLKKHSSYPSVFEKRFQNRGCATYEGIFFKASF